MLARRRSASIAIVGFALVAFATTPRLAFAAARSASTTAADEVVSLQQNSAHTGSATAAYDVVNGQGVIFTRGADNTVKAFNAATGALLWSVPTYNGTASPVAANGLVYISYSNQMTALRE